MPVLAVNQNPSFGVCCCVWTHRRMGRRSLTPPRCLADASLYFVGFSEMLNKVTFLHESLGCSGSGTAPEDRFYKCTSAGRLRGYAAHERAPPTEHGVEDLCREGATGGLSSQHISRCQWRGLDRTSHTHAPTHTSTQSLPSDASTTLSPSQLSIRPATLQIYTPSTSRLPPSLALLLRLHLLPSPRARDRETRARRCSFRLAKGRRGIACPVLRLRRRGTKIAHV